MSTKKGSSDKKGANQLVVMSSAAVLAVYAAGYSHTQHAADRLTAQFAKRRPVSPSAPLRSLPTADSHESPAVEPAGAAATTPHLAAAAGQSPKAEAAPVAPAEKPAGTAAAPSTAEPVTIAATPSAAPASEPAPISAQAKSEVAEAPSAAAPATAVREKPVWKDGTYLGWGHCRHGTLQASVVVEAGRIASATIAQCYTRYPCTVISMLPPQVPQRQSAEVDRVSSATESADAFYFAIVDALEKAK
jgi:uncharacterized protein with FMN-binding domain